MPFDMAVFGSPMPRVVRHVGVGLLLRLTRRRWVVAPWRRPRYWGGALVRLPVRDVGLVPVLSKIGGRCWVGMGMSKMEGIRHRQ